MNVLLNTKFLSRCERSHICSLWQWAIARFPDEASLPFLYWYLVMPRERDSHDGAAALASGHR